MNRHAEKHEDPFIEATNEAIALLLGLSVARTGGENPEELKSQLSSSAAKLIELIQRIGD